ncbi:hypothetical protein FXO37_16524 [Capsicum annuum]|nr:hypothetical protein FXO37_16524 [Capsicum annuum]
MPETTTANTRNGELRQEVDELREQTRIQEIRQLLITIVANQVPQRADGPVENAPTGNGFNFDQGNKEFQETLIGKGIDFKEWNFLNFMVTTSRDGRIKRSSISST